MYFSIQVLGYAYSENYFKMPSASKNKGVIDEIPAAYKDNDTVMANQRDLVETVHTLKQIVCVKG